VSGLCGRQEVLTREVVKMPPGDRRFATAGTVVEEPIRCEYNRSDTHRCILPFLEHLGRHLCGCGWTWKP